MQKIVLLLMALLSASIYAAAPVSGKIGPVAVEIEEGSMTDTVLKAVSEPFTEAWLDEYTMFYQENDEAYYAEYGSYPYAHDLNKDGLYIDIHKILNGFEDETILYDDIGHFYGEDERCSTDIQVINGIRYKDSYLKDVLSGDITSLTKRESDPIMSRLYKAVISSDDDRFVYIMITLEGHEDGTAIYLSYETIDTDPNKDDLPIIVAAYKSSTIIVS